jgi:hypothetical protein
VLVSEDFTTLLIQLLMCDNPGGFEMAKGDKRSDKRVTLDHRSIVRSLPPMAHGRYGVDSTTSRKPARSSAHQDRRTHPPRRVLPDSDQ